MADDEREYMKMASMNHLLLWGIIAFGATVLIATFLEVWWVFSAERSVGGGSIALALSLFLGVLASEWRWRLPLMRAFAAGMKLVVVGVSLLWLWLRSGTNAWLRWASDRTNAVMEYGGEPVTSEYRQGLLTFKRVADAALDDAVFPLSVLVLLAIIPALQAANDLRKESSRHQ